MNWLSDQLNYELTMMHKNCTEFKNNYEFESLRNIFSFISQQ